MKAHEPETRFDIILQERDEWQRKKRMLEIAAQVARLEEDDESVRWFEREYLAAHARYVEACRWFCAAGPHLRPAERTSGGLPEVSAETRCLWPGSYQKENMLNLLATTIGTGSFRAFITAISRAKLGHLLTEPGPFTVLVPTDAAFAEATGGGMWSLSDDIPTLARVLACHIVPGKWTAGAMVKQRSLTTLRQEHVKVELDGGIRVGGAHVLKPDLLAANGVIHIIDRVILPFELPHLGVNIDGDTIVYLDNG